MVLYITIIVALVILLVLSILGRMTPKNLNKNELMKISILQNCSLTKEEATSELEALDITVVQKIGRQLVCYKQSDNAKNPIIFEK